MRQPGSVSGLQGSRQFGSLVLSQGSCLQFGSVAGSHVESCAQLASTEGSHETELGDTLATEVVSSSVVLVTVETALAVVVVVIVEVAVVRSGSVWDWVLVI